MQNEVDWSIFESLFVRAFQPTGTFADELKMAGLDLKSPLPRYPESTLTTALDVAWRHAYPRLTRDEAHRKLGLRSGERFFETRVGSVMGAAMPLVGPDRVMASMPRRIKSGTTGDCQVEKLSDGDWRITFGATTSPEFAAGNLVAALRRCKVTPTAQVEPTSDGKTHIRVRWS